MQDLLNSIKSSVVPTETKENVEAYLSKVNAIEKNKEEVRKALLKK